MQLPPGYQVHPQNLKYMWNPTTNDVQPMDSATPAPAVPTAPTPSVGEVAYGTLDVNAAAVEEKDPRIFGGGREKNFIYIDFPPLGKNVGDEVTLLVRLLPPWAVGVGSAHVKTARHRILAEFVPNAPGDRKFFFYDCHDSISGPGNCPIDASFKSIAENPNAEKPIEEMKPRASIVWQMVNLDEPSKHFIQQLDNAGQPATNADGTPSYRVVPGILRMGNQLHLDILKFIGEKGDPTHPESGYTMKLTRRRKNLTQFGVEYSAMDLTRDPLHETMRPVLANLIDLRAQFVDFRPREELEAIAQNIMRRFGVGLPQPTMSVPGIPTSLPDTSTAMPAGTWSPHPGMPGWEYNDHGQVRQIAAVAPVPPVPPAPPPVPPIPPVVATPPAVVAPPAPPAPSGLPPAVAPGGIPAPEPVGAMPPTPPPPPGVPVGVEGPPSAPPIPEAPPSPPGDNGRAKANSAMSVEAFEAQEFGPPSDQTKIPF